MLKFTTTKASRIPTRVRIALAEKGLSDTVVFISIDVPRGEHRLLVLPRKTRRPLFPRLSSTMAPASANARPLRSIPTIWSANRRDPENPPGHLRRH